MLVGVHANVPAYRAELIFFAVGAAATDCIAFVRVF